MHEALREQRMMAQQDQQISEAIEREKPRLRNFIRKRVARNRITDLFRSRKWEVPSEPAGEAVDGDELQWEDLLPSPDAGPESAYARSVLLEEMEAALDELPTDQREVFIGHE